MNTFSTISSDDIVRLKARVAAMVSALRKLNGMLKGKNMNAVERSLVEGTVTSLKAECDALRIEGGLEATRGPKIEVSVHLNNIMSELTLKNNKLAGMSILELNTMNEGVVSKPKKKKETVLDKIDEIAPRPSTDDNK